MYIERNQYYMEFCQLISVCDKTVIFVFAQLLVYQKPIALFYKRLPNITQLNKTLRHAWISIRREDLPSEYSWNQNHRDLCLHFPPFQVNRHNS